MSIFERVAWIHRTAVTLGTSDLVELKHGLKGLIAEASEALEAVKVEIEAQRGQAGRKTKCNIIVALEGEKG